MLKKIINISILMIAIFLFASCGGVNKDNDKVSDGKPTVCATTSFLGDMTKELAGDFVNIEVIIPAGDDPHLYVAKPEDHDKLKKADLVLYHGLHFEGKMVEILELLGTSVSEDFPKDKIGRMAEDGQEVIDPHFWFDIDLYKMAVVKASEALIKLLPEQKSTLEKNTDDYIAKLDDLSNYCVERISEIPADHRYLITPHDAFNYFSRYFGIEVHAPQGVSTDSEVSISDVNKTVDFIVEHKIKAIFAESTTDPARMKSIQEAVSKQGFDVKVVSGEGNELFSDSLAPIGSPGDNYIDMYKHNIDLIVDNLK